MAREKGTAHSNAALDGLYSSRCGKKSDSGVNFKILNFVRDKSKIPCFERGKAKILTTGIYLIFRGLKFEPDAETGQKGAFLKLAQWRRGIFFSIIDLSG